MKITSEILKGAVLVSWLLSPMLLGETKDTILRRGTRPLEGVTVTGETYQDVSYEMIGPTGAKAEGKVNADEVLEVLYGDAPLPYQSALSYLENGQYENALKQLDDASQVEVARGWPKKYIPFLKGGCLRRLGRNEEAIKEYEGLLQGASQSRFAPQCVWGIANCHLVMGGDHLTEALKKFNELGLKDYPAIWKLRSRIGNVLVKEAQGKALAEGAVTAEAEVLLKEALKGCEEIIQLGAAAAEAAEGIFDPTDERCQDVLFDAKLRKGVMLVILRNQEEAVKWYTELVEEALDNRRREAEAFNLRGDCFFTFQQYARALWDYQRVAAVYFTDREQLQHALKRCAECAGQLGDKGAVAAYQADYERRYEGEGFGDIVIAVVERQDDEGDGADGPDAAEKEYAKILADGTVWMGQTAVGQVQKGQFIDFLGKSDDGQWAYVSLGDGKKGYLAIKAVEVVKGKPEAPEAVEEKPKPERANFVTVNKDGAVVYDGKQKPVHRAKQGETFDVLEQSKGWYGIQITVDNRKISGWISAQDVNYTAPRK